MILKDIYIDGFGIFNGFELKSLDKGVNILVGNNEAGKSTLLKFLRYTLFGYPRLINDRLQPLHGGNHGGRINAVLGSGKEVLFERYGNNDIKLLYNRQESKNESEWFQLLGNASHALFNNVFSFTLDELVNMGSLKESGVEDKIFSVGLGLGNISLGALENNIQARADHIYTPRGKVQVIPAILKELNEKKSKIREIQENLPKYRELTGQINDLEIETNELGDKLEELRLDYQKLENYLKCYDYFITVINADKELSDLPELQDYEEKGAEKLDKLEESEQDLKENIFDLQNGTEEEKGIGGLEEEIRAISYNAEVLEKSDNVEYLQKNLEKYKQTVNDRKDDAQKIADKNQNISDEIKKINSNWSEKDVTGFSEIVARRSKVEGFKTNFDKIADNKRNLEAEIKAVEATKSPLNVTGIARLFSVLFLLGAVPAFYYGIFVLGGAFIAIALVLFFGNKFFRKESVESRLKQEFDKLIEKEKTIVTKFKKYLTDELNLPGSLPAEATLEVLKQIDQLKTNIRERDKLVEKQQKQREPFIREFEDEVSLFDGILTRDEQKENIETFVNHIISRFNHSQSQSQVKDALVAELKRKQKAKENVQIKLDNNQTEIKGLLNLVGAADRLDFRKRYADNNKAKELIANRDAALQIIEKIAGLDKSDEVVGYLNTHEKETIESEKRELSNQIDDKAKEHSAAKESLGGKKTELENLEGESKLAEVLTGLETERQKLQIAYKDWITNKLALHILSEVKSKYEREKQPAVIKNSGNYFKRITNGRYDRIRVSLDEKEVSIYDAAEASKKIEQLSRGTKEQLLISLRLGLIEEYEKQAEPLPVIVDEVFVNFDPYRAKETAEIFQDFGKDRQILIFTCHPATVDYFDGGDVNLIGLSDN